MLNQTTKNKLYQYVTQNLGMRQYVRGWLKGDCPSCGRIDKFGVNLSLNRTNCFVCGYHPTPITLVADVEGLSSISDSLQYLNVFEGLRYLEPQVERVERKPIYLPEGYVNIAMGNSTLSNIMRKYVIKRGFDVGEVSLKGWGYCNKGDYFGYLILPFYTGGKLTYFNGRLVVGSGPKYRNPQIEEFGIGKSLILYNADALAIYDEVYLLEGIFNADTLGDNAIATGGKNISDYQISLINKSPIKRIIVVLDPDAAINSIKVGLKMAFHKEVKLVIWDGDKDVNDLGRKRSLKKVNKASWLTYNEILKLKHEKDSKHSYYQG